MAATSSEAGRRVEGACVADARSSGQATGRGRRNRNWEARRQSIVDVSARVFARSSYHGTGIAELCEANELGKGALYYYIGSKEELLAAIHDRVMDEVLRGAERVEEAGGSPRERLARAGHELLDIITRYPDHVWVFLHEFPALTGERAKQFRKRRHDYERRLEAIVADGVASGEFLDVDPRLTTLAWLGMHNYTYLWLKPKGSLSAAAVADRFAEIFIGGIAADHGAE
jgi:AcrR family transcriptional regulator